MCGKQLVFPSLSEEPGFGTLLALFLNVQVTPLQPATGSLTKKSASAPSEATFGGTLLAVTDAKRMRTEVGSLSGQNNAHPGVGRGAMQLDEHNKRTKTARLGRSNAQSATSEVVQLPGRGTQLAFTPVAQNLCFSVVAVPSSEGSSDSTALRGVNAMDAGLPGFSTQESNWVRHDQQRSVDAAQEGALKAPLVYGDVNVVDFAEKPQRVSSPDSLQTSEETSPSQPRTSQSDRTDAFSASVSERRLIGKTQHNELQPTTALTRSSATERAAVQQLTSDPALQRAENFTQPATGKHGTVSPGGTGSPVVVPETPVFIANQAEVWSVQMAASSPPASLTATRSAGPAVLQRATTRPTVPALQVAPLKTQVGPPLTQSEALGTSSPDLAPSVSARSSNAVAGLRAPAAARAPFGPPQPGTVLFETTRDSSAASFPLGPKGQAMSQERSTVSPEPEFVSHGRLLQSVEGSTMQVSLQGGDLGRVLVRANYARNTLSAHIAADSPQLGAAIAAHLPAAEQKLLGEHGMRAALTVATSTESSGDGRNQSQTQPQRPPPAKAAAQLATSATDSLALPRSGFAPDTGIAQTAAGRINLRI